MVSSHSSRSSSESSENQVPAEDPIRLVSDDPIVQPTSNGGAQLPKSNPHFFSSTSTKNTQTSPEIQAQAPRDQSDNTRNSVDEDENPYVPRKERRGLFPLICLVPEKKEPHDYHPRIKDLIVFTIAFAAMVGPMGGSIFLPAMQDISKSLNTTRDIVNISYGLYVLSLGIFPLWWSSISEQFGRRTVYIISFTAYVGFLIGCAMSTSIGMLMGFRILSGAGAAAVQAVGAGTIGDLYVTTQRGTAMGYFYLGPLVGPLIGPLAGGAIVTKWGWRGTQWFLMIVTSAILILLLLVLPETLRVELVPKQVLEEVVEEEMNSSQTEEKTDDLGHPHRRLSISSFQQNEDDDIIGDTIVPSMSRLSRFQTTEDDVGAVEAQATTLAKEPTTASAKLRKLDRPLAIDFKSLTFKEKAYLLVVKPLRSLKFLKYPPVLLSIAYSSFCFFCLYFFNVSLESVYTSPPHNFGPVIVGLMYIPNSLGYVISSIVSGRWSDHVVKRARRHADDGVFIPEARFAEHVYFGAALYPLALILFGWTAQKQVFWFIPLIGSFLFGISSMIIFGTTMTYLIDALPGRGSSGVAVNNLVRMILAAVATFVAEPLQNAMGYGWLYTMWGLVGLALSVCIVAIKLRGQVWRSKVNFDKLYS